MKDTKIVSVFDEQQTCNAVELIISDCSDRVLLILSQPGLDTACSSVFTVKNNPEVVAALRVLYEAIQESKEGETK